MTFTSILKFFPHLYLLISISGLNFLKSKFAELKKKEQNTKEENKLLQEEIERMKIQREKQDTKISSLGAYAHSLEIFIDENMSFLFAQLEELKIIVKEKGEKTSKPEAKVLLFQPKKGKLGRSTSHQDLHNP